MTWLPERCCAAAYNGDLIFIANEYARAAGISVEWSGGAATASMKWENDDNLPSTSSPAVDNKYLFLAGAEGEVTCHSVKDGKVVWDQEFDEGFYASPIIVKDKVYLLDRDGVMRIFAVGPEYRSLGDPELGEKAVATPAFVRESIIIRGEKHLFRIGK